MIKRMISSTITMLLDFINTFSFADKCCFWCICVFIID